MTESRATYLNRIVVRYERVSFIGSDPICIPHGFSSPRDQEIIGLFAAVMAWGRRDTMIAKLGDLCERMDYHPYRFVRDFSLTRDGWRLEGFKHRTFRSDDAQNLVLGLQSVLTQYGSIENLCAANIVSTVEHVGPAIEALTTTLLSRPAEMPVRLRKHLPRPSAGSACKRLCMFFRWMIRPGPVDLGIWKAISPSKLVLPLDVHSGRQARMMGLLNRKTNDWRAALELTRACSDMDRDDPARYDFAFFGTGVAGETLHWAPCEVMRP